MDPYAWHCLASCRLAESPSKLRAEALYSHPHGEKQFRKGFRVQDEAWHRRYCGSPSHLFI